jgi:hypothetical protein
MAQRVPLWERKHADGSGRTLASQNAHQVTFDCFHYFPLLKGHSHKQTVSPPHFWTCWPTFSISENGLISSLRLFASFLYTALPSAHVTASCSRSLATIKDSTEVCVSVGLVEGRLANLSHMRLTYLLLIFTIHVLLFLSPVSYPKPN